VPRHLKDTHYQGSARLGHGKGYKYAHDYAGGYVEQDYLGVDRTYYEPVDRGYEAEIADRMARLRAAAQSADANDSAHEVSE
jgi:putative ATPase